jgi:hypothetical protein
LRSQLKTAQDANDKPAIIELSRRIVTIAPNDSDTWDALAQTQLEIEHLDGLERTLDGWQKALRRPPAAIDDLRAGLCFKRENYQCAEQHWLGFIGMKPLGRPRRIPGQGDCGTGHSRTARITRLRAPSPSQVGRRVRRHGEGEQNGCYRSASEGVAPAIAESVRRPPLGHTLENRRATLL